MLANVTFNYYESQEKMTRERWARLQAEMPGTFGEWKEDKEKCPYFVYDGVIDLETDGRLLAECEVPVTIKRYKGNYFPHELGYQHRINSDDRATNITQVHIPNLGLLAIRNVMVLEDACTDKLQQHLDDGWSILAVCPPNSVRRPDYILGKA